MATVTRWVATKEQLKSALKERADTIVITDKGLATSVRITMSVKKSALVMVAGAGAVVAANAWNPVGWVGAAGLAGTLSTLGGGALASGVAAGGVSGTAVLIAAIGAMTVLGSLLLVMHNEYEIEAKGNGFASSKNAAGATAEGASASNANKASGSFEFALKKRSQA